MSNRFIEFFVYVLWLAIGLRGGWELGRQTLQVQVAEYQQILTDVGESLHVAADRVEANWVAYPHDQELAKSLRFYGEWCKSIAAE